MSKALHHEILAILREGKDLTLATLRSDGAPQATTVSYASDGLAILFGCGEHSQKARNLARDSRVALTINLPYADWGQIRGLSVSGRAERLTDAEDLARAGELFLAKFPEVAQYVATGGEIAMFRVTPEVISVLDYGQGFGHTDLVGVSDAAGEPRIKLLSPTPA